ncbi:Uncharacterised protein [uncultured archaeon]|nr:Uncharacterised protein [uncultured archaeon]
MGLFRNTVDAAVITLSFFLGGLAIQSFGVDFMKDTILTPLGVLVSFLLAFMETTYNRF